MKRKFLSIILSLTMVILTIPVASISAITNIVTSPITSVSLDFSIIAGDWTGTGSYEGVNWVSASRALTLTNANVYGNDSSSGDCYGMNLPSDTTIILNGNSTVTGGVSASTYSYGIYSEGSLTIQGEGSLSVTSGTGVAYVCGICVATGTMTVSSGNIVATGGTAASSYGIVNNDGDIIISGGNVTVTGGTATNSYGIVSPKSLYVTGGTLVATGGVASTESYGIRSTLSTSLSGGLIVAKGTTKALYSAPIGEISTPLSGGDTLTSAVYGTSEYKVLTTGLDCSTLTEDTGTLFTNGYEWINSTKTLTIENLVISTSDLTALYFPSGATLNVQGVNVIISGDSSKGNAKSRCIFGIGALNIQGDGAVTTISGKADYSISIYTNTNINISGCKVTAIGGNSNRCSYGFQIMNNLTISNCYVTAIGGTSVGSSQGIVAGGVISFSGSNITAIGGITTQSYNVGIYAHNKMTVSGGNITGISSTINSSTNAGIRILLYLTNLGGSITAIGKRAALGESYLCLDSVLVSIASTTVDGATPVSYSRDNIFTYKYVKIAPVPTYAATVTINKDNVVYSSGTPTMQLSTSSTALAGAITGTCSNGIYTFSDLSTDTTYYIWDTTNNIYTKQSVTSTANTATVNYYTVTLNFGTGIASTSGGGVYLKNSTVSISATLNTGYTWTQWTGTSTNSSQTFSLSNISQAYVFTANATAISATVPSLVTTVENGTYGYAESSVYVSVAATPAAGHTITGYQWYDNGTTNSSTGGSLISGATNSVYDIPTGKNAGNYYYYCVVTTTRTDNGQIASVTTYPATHVTISKLENVISKLHVVYGNYNGGTQTVPTFSKLGTGAATIEYKIHKQSDDTYTTDLPINAGKYDIRITVAADDNYNEVSSTYSYLINQRAITVSGITAENKTFDGSIDANLDFTGAILSGIVDGDSLTVSASGAFENANVANDKTVNIANLTLGGTSADNYSLSDSENQTTTAADITTKGLTTSNISINGINSSYIYTNNEVMPIPTSIISGTTTLQNGTDYTLSYNNNINVGTNTASIIIDFKGNYSGSVSKTFSIAYGTATYSMFSILDELSSFTNNPITVSPTDGYMVCTEPAGTYSSSVTIDTESALEGSNYTFYLKDLSGAIFQKIVTYKLDTTKPSQVTVSFGTNNFKKIANVITFGLFFKETVTVTFTATDSLSGVKEFKYTLSDDTEKTITANNGSASLSIQPQFKGNISGVKAADNAGNISDETDTEYFAVDSNPPSTPTVNTNGYISDEWTHNHVSFTVSNSEAISGILKYQYSIDNGTTWIDMETTQSEPATSDVPFSAEEASLAVTSNTNGISYIFRSVSNSGLNSTQSAATIVKIDISLPYFELSTDTSNYLQSDTVTITPNIGISGLLKIEVKKDDGSFTDITSTYQDGYIITANGKYTFSVTNNVDVSFSTSRTYTNIDTAKPVVSVDSNGYTENTWLNSGDISLTVSNSTANLGQTTIEYKIDDGSWQLYTEPITISSDCSATTYTFRATSESGVVSDLKTFVVKRDSFVPTGKICMGTNLWRYFISTITFKMFFKDTQTVTITSNDATSGVSSVQYLESETPLSLWDLRGISSWTTGTSVNVNPVDAKKFIYYAKISDEAGKVAYLSTDGATFDTTNPAISGVTNGATYYVTQRATINDTNLDIVTLNENTVESPVVMNGNRDTTYTISVHDKARNATVVKFSMKTIASLTTSIGALTEDIVKSSDNDTIEAVKLKAVAIDLTYATQAEKDEVQAVTDVCNTLLQKIIETAAQKTRLTNAVDGYSSDLVKSNDTDSLNQLETEINALISSGNLTDAEQTTLNTTLDKSGALLQKITETAAQKTRLTNAVDGYSTNLVKSNDTDSLNQLETEINALISSGNLTDAEQTALNTTLDKSGALLQKIDDAKSASNPSTYNAVKDIDIDNLKMSDKESLTQAKTDFGNALSSLGENYSDAEKAEIQSKINTITDLLKSISNVENVNNKIVALPYSSNVQSGDADAIKEAKSAYDCLSDYEKAFISEDMCKKLTKASTALANLLLKDKPTGTSVQAIDDTEFDPNTVLTITRVTPNSTQTNGIKVAANDKGTVSLYDVKLLLDGNPVELGGNVKVTLTLTSDQLANYNNFEIIYIDDNGNTTIIPSEVTGNQISFITNHFSFYGIIGKEVVKEIPTTGETTHPILYVLLTLFAAAVLVVCVKKKKQKKTK